MNKISFIILLLALLSACKQAPKQSTSTNQTDLINQLPKVLFITTGVDLDREDKDLPKGIIVALQTFNKRGISVRLEPRDVLFDYDFLTKYNIIILSSSKGYHDADRKFSLTYMTDEELNILKKYVQNGGILITGDNIGRNRFDGTDRIVKDNELNAVNYPLADVLGMTMQEKNMSGYEIKASKDSPLQGVLLNKTDEDYWTLVPKKILSDKLQSLAFWKKENDSIPAITQNRFGSGTTYALASSDFMNPIASEGYWSVAQIDTFYNYVIDQLVEDHKLKIQVNPWPNGHTTAFSATFNPVGDIAQFRYVAGELKKLDVAPTFVVTGTLNDTIKNFLQSKNNKLMSGGYGYIRYNEMNYAEAVHDILRNEKVWNQKFSGFRFPYTDPDFFGLLALDVHQYQYESSITANNIDFLQGSVFPYNLVISKDNFYKSTNILEIAPTYYDDYFFLNKLIDKEYANPNEMQKDIELYKQYLLDFWQYATKPHNGLMVYLGHPGLTGYNKDTFSPLKTLIDTVKKDNAWITSMEDIKNYSTAFEKTRVFVTEDNNAYTITIKAPKGVFIKQFSINIKEKPVNIKVKKGQTSVVKNTSYYSVVFDTFDGQEVVIEK